MTHKPLLISGTATLIAACLLAIAPVPAHAAARAGPTPPQDCARTDTLCRLDRIEARLDLILDRLEDHRGGDAASTDISVAANERCDAGACISRARSVCQQAGLQGGVPARMEGRRLPNYELPLNYMTRVTCQRAPA